MATAKVALTGIQLYRGAEVDRPDLDVVRVMRPEEEVFNKDSLASFVGKPMTNEHPAKPVRRKLENWRHWLNRRGVLRTAIISPCL